MRFRTLLFVSLLSIFLAILPATAQECSATKKCATGCYSELGFCGLGKDYCVSLVSAPQDTGAKPPIHHIIKPFGCWSSLDNSSRVLLGTAWTNYGVTLNTCAKACLADGYPLAGFDDSSHTCHCGDRVLPNSARLSMSPCTTDGVSLYGLVEGATLGGVPFASVGCFADSALVTDPGALIGTTPPTQTTVARCASLCLEAYAYFGLSHGDTCRCGTGVAPGATALDMGGNCNVPCTARGDTACGGDAATHIYTSETARRNSTDGGGDGCY